MSSEILATSNETVTLSENLEKHQTQKAFSLLKEEPAKVQPASETPRGLYFLSNLDQTIPIPIEMAISYKGHVNKERDYCEVELLREAMQKVLVEFYPLAGHLTMGNDGKMIVACTGEGVQFVKAISEDNMDVIGDLSMIDPMKLRQLVHYNDNIYNALDLPLLTVQVTKFKCGGIIVGVVANHVLMDGKALVDFLLCWSELARGNQLSIKPFLDRSFLLVRQAPEIKFRHLEYSTEIRLGNLIPLDSKKPLAYKSFCLTPSMISQLKKSVLKDGFTGTTPTTFQVISALVWTLHTMACGMKPNETTKVITAVDGRPRFEPAMPERFFGNGIGFSCAECLVGDLLEKPFPFVVQLVQDAHKKVTESYIRSAIDYIETTKVGFIEVDNVCYVTKWCRLGFYNIDFGWGKPAQVAPTSTSKNMAVVLYHNKDSENIVVSLCLPFATMEVFDELFLSQLNHIVSM